jgi:hypothetical protein
MSGPRNPLMVSFTTRAGSPWLPPDGVSFAVESLTRDRRWQYKSATITASGPRQAVFELLEILRYGVKIYSATDLVVWLGYVNTVRVNDRGSLTGVSLDDMANRVAVAYSYVEPGTSTVGVRKTTAWADDLASQAEFGVKELLISSDGTTDAGAEQLRDTYLAEHSTPVGTSSYNGISGGDIVTAQIDCLGWLYTLGWTTYANSDQVDTATSTQIADILDAGEFITSVTVETASGITSSEYRKGDLTALEELLALMDIGTTNGKTYQCEIDEARNVRVIEAPANTVISYRRTADGRVWSPSDELLDGYRIEAGRWVELKDVIPASVDTTWLKAVGKYLVDEATWLASRPDTPILTPAGARGGGVGLYGGGGSGLSLPKIQAAVSESGTYTPAWTGDSGNPVIGDGWIVGSYVKIGRQVTAQVLILAGSTTTFGSGWWRVSLPFAPAAELQVGLAQMYDASTFKFYMGFGRITGSAVLVFVNDNGNAVSSTLPFTWASGDQLSLTITYIAA